MSNNNTFYRKDFNGHNFYMIVSGNRMITVRKGFKGLSHTITSSTNPISIEEAFNAECSGDATEEEFAKAYKIAQQEILSIMIKK